MVKVKFMGPYRSLMPEKDEDGYWVVDAQGQSIEHFLENTPVKEHFMNCSVVINSWPKQKEYILQDEDVLLVIPLFAAG
ncbi:MAG: hypothetical protein R3Y58_11215 [Eubacteriales bacterium]